MSWQYPLLEHSHPHLLRLYGHFTLRFLQKITNEPDPQKREALLHAYIHYLKEQFKKKHENPEENLDKLIWSHIYQLSEGNLGVPLPYPEEELKGKEKTAPDRLNYPKGAPLFRSYGRLIETYIETLQNETNKQKRHLLLKHVFRVLWTWRHLHDTSAPNSETILKDLQSLIRNKQKPQVEKDLSFIEVEDSVAYPLPQKKYPMRKRKH